MNISLEDLHELPKKMFDDKIASIVKQTSGKLIVKEYPTASANSNHFRGLIKELAIKKSFKPDIVFVDYLNICASSRFKGGANINSYTLVKSIAEELRGLAVETNVPIYVCNSDYSFLVSYRQILVWKILQKVLDYQRQLTLCLH